MKEEASSSTMRNLQKRTERDTKLLGTVYKSSSKKKQARLRDLYLDTFLTVFEYNLDSLVVVL